MGRSEAAFMRKVKMDGGRVRREKPRVNWGKMMKSGLALAGIVGAAWYLATVPNMCMEERLQARMRMERSKALIEALEKEREAGKSGENRQSSEERDAGSSSPK
jgi:hypothetical protein